MQILPRSALLVLLASAASFSCFADILPLDRTEKSESQWSSFGQEGAGAVSPVQGGILMRAAGSEGETFAGASQSIPCVPNAALRFSVTAKGVESLKNCTGQISIQWMDSTGKEISRSWGPVWSDALPSGGVMEFDMSATSPGEAATAVLAITLREKGRASGAFCIQSFAIQTPAK